MNFFELLRHVSDEAIKEVETWPEVERESVKRFYSFGSMSIEEDDEPKVASLHRTSPSRMYSSRHHLLLDKK
jgi:hypothetical protein